MTVIDANGKVQASSGRFSGPQPPPAPDRSHAAREGAERSTEVQEISAGQILIAMLPIRPRFQQQSTPGGSAAWRLLEIAIYLRGPQGMLHPLHRNLVILGVAAIALLAAIIVFMGCSGHMSARRRWRPSFQRPGLFNGCCFLRR
jgi:hypothetical protein